MQASIQDYPDGVLSSPGKWFGVYTLGIVKKWMEMDRVYMTASLAAKYRVTDY